MCEYRNVSARYKNMDTEESKCVERKMSSTTTDLTSFPFSGPFWVEILSPDEHFESYVTPGVVQER